MPSTNDNNNQDQEVEEYKGSSLCHPASNFHRYFFLIFMCFLGFGNYFCYDTPGSLSEQIQNEMHVSTSEVMLLYSLYSLPNIILTLFNGYIVDRYLGICWGAILFSSLTVAGQALLGFGALTNTFWLMLVGRFVFGIGGESLGVTQNMRSVKWYNGKELNMVFGLQLSINRGGSSITFIVMEILYDWLAKGYTENRYRAIGIAFLIAGGTVIVDLLNATMLMFRDNRAERILKMKEEAAKKEETKISPKDIFTFKLIYWVVILIIVFYYVTVFPFISIGKPLYRHKFHFTSKQAGVVTSLVYILSGVLCPFLGAAIGQFGRNISWVLLAAVLSWAGHALIAFTFITPWVAMVLLGIGYSVFACTVWAMISLIIPEHQLGTAYGMAFAIQNLGFAIVGYVAGLIVDSKGYLVLEIFFLGMLSVTIILTTLLYVIDENDTGVLNMSPTQRTERQEKLDQSESSRKSLSGNRGADMIGIDGVYKPTEMIMMEETNNQLLTHRNSATKLD